MRSLIISFTETLAMPSRTFSTKVLPDVRRLIGNSAARGNDPKTWVRAATRSQAIFIRQ